MSTRRKKPRPEISVTRDPTFHRAVADKVLVFDLGRDVEFSFLQTGPVVRKVVDFDEETEQAELGGSLSEVARIRMSGPVALSVAVNVIDTLVGAGRVKTPAFRETILKVFEAHASEEAGAAE